MKKGIPEQEAAHSERADRLRRLVLELEALDGTRSWAVETPGFWIKRVVAQPRAARLRSQGQKVNV